MAFLLPEERAEKPHCAMDISLTCDSLASMAHALAVEFQLPTLFVGACIGSIDSCSYVSLDFLCVFSDRKNPRPGNQDG